MTDNINNTNKFKTNFKVTKAAKINNGTNGRHSFLQLTLHYDYIPFTSESLFLL